MKKWVLLVVIAAVLLGVAGWRFWPCSATGLGVPEAGTVTELSLYGMVGRFENGQSSHVNYTMYANDTAQIGEILALLNTCRYQQDFRNLWPWGIDSVGSDGNYDSRTVEVGISTGDTYLSIRFLSPTIVAVSSSRWSGYRIYHPTNRQAMDAVIAYLQQHGTIQ